MLLLLVSYEPLHFLIVTFSSDTFFIIHTRSLFVDSKTIPVNETSIMLHTPWSWQSPFSVIQRLVSISYHILSYQTLFSISYQNNKHKNTTWYWGCDLKAKKTWDNHAHIPSKTIMIKNKRHFTNRQHTHTRHAPVEINYSVCQ